MNTCFHSCVLKLRAKIANIPSRQLVLDVRNMPEELRDKLCDDRDTCQNIVFQNWKQLSLRTLKLNVLTRAATHVFNNVVCLDVSWLHCGVTVFMPGVLKLTLHAVDDADNEWLRISTMFPNVEYFEFLAEASFTFTESWLSDKVFPKLTRIKVSAFQINTMHEIAAAKPRDIAELKFTATRCILEGTFTRMVNPATIQSLKIVPFAVFPLPDIVWWKAVKTLRRLDLGSDGYDILTSLRRGEDARLKTEFVSLGFIVTDPVLPSNVPAFLQQESQTLRIVTCHYYFSSGMAWQNDFELAKRIFTDYPRLQIVSAIMHDHPGAKHFVFFVPSPHNVAWIRRKAKDNSVVIQEYFVPDAKRNVHKTDLCAL